jgi:hypothetical protein
MPLDTLRYLFPSLLLVPIHKQLSSFISIGSVEKKSSCGWVEKRGLALFTL